jgi:large subunit ribosomal protein L4
MELPIYNMAGEETGRMELPAAVFEANVNRGLMHQALVRQLANARQGTHKAKGRSEVSYSTRKLYRQKGTGRARHGSRKAPIYVGGGVAHGPLPRSYRKQMPRKMRRAALRSALTVKAVADEIVLLDEISMEQPKTKEMVALMNRLVGGDSALLLMAGKDVNVEKSANNLQSVKTLRADYLNIRDLLGFDKIVIPLAAMDVITGFLGEQERLPADEAAESMEE